MVSFIADKGPWTSIHLYCKFLYLIGIRAHIKACYVIGLKYKSSLIICLVYLKNVENTG